MTNQLRRVIPVSRETIDYEQILGEKITPHKLAGYRRHVIGENYLSGRKTLRIDRNGDLVIV